MLNRRIQILLDKDSLSKLSDLAKTQKTSMGEAVRRAIDKAYEREKELDQRRMVIDEIRRIRPAPFKGKIDYKALINYGRE